MELKIQADLNIAHWCACGWILLENVLTDRLTVLHVIAITEVFRGKMLTTTMVTHAHSIPTNTTDPTPLQQGRTFSGWTVAAIDPVSLGVVAQALLDLLVLLPGDIARMCIRDEHLPLILR